MSHAVTVKSQFKDLPFLASVVEGTDITVDLRPQTITIGGRTVDAQAVIKLPKWVKPIAVVDNELVFDNYEGRWGNILDLVGLKKLYGEAKIAQIADRTRAVVVKDRVTTGVRVRLQAGSSRQRATARR